MSMFFSKIQEKSIKIKNKLIKIEYIKHFFIFPLKENLGSSFKSNSSAPLSI